MKTQSISKISWQQAEKQSIRFEKHDCEFASAF